MSDNCIIALSGVNKRYLMGNSIVQALKDIDLEVRRSDFLAIMGPSGSGKSTLMNILGLLDRPNEGSYLLDDREVGTLDDNDRSRVRNRTIGFIFQNFNLLQRTTALRNVMLPLTYRRLSDDERNKRALVSLGMVGLKDRADHQPMQLSGGEQQRVAIARALVGEPLVVLADEPTGNLDSKTGMGIIEILSNLAKSGKAVITVTHDPTVAKHADHVISMLDGNIRSYS
ncbi:ABC transporter ATP-binding protein [bacterium]|nr:ABC transporter ATP-binding protein [bacterium]